MYKPNYKTINQKYYISIINRANKLVKEDVYDCLNVVVEPLINNYTGKFDNVLIYKYFIKESPFKEPLFYFGVNEEGTITRQWCEVCGSINCAHIVGAIINMETNPVISDEQISEILKAEEERMAREEYERLRYESMISTNNLVEKITQQEALVLFNQVDLEVTLSSGIYDEYNEKIQKCYLILKVGYDKKYVVKNINLFLDNIQKHETIKYGQNFAFNHSINNFTKKAQNLLNILIKNRVNNLYDNTRVNSKIFYVNKYILDELMNTFQGDYLNIQYDANNLLASINDCNVLLDEYLLKLKLNKDYCLEASNVDKLIYLIGHENDYLVIDQTIYTVSYPNIEMRPIYQFLATNPDFTFKYVKDVLSQQVLGRFYNEIEIDPVINNEFLIKDYRIEAYFDYVGENIEVVTKVFCEDELISINDINDVIISNKITRYRYYLQALGFDENGVLSDPIKINAFLRTNLSDLRKIATIFLSEAIKKTQVKTLKKFKMRLSYDVDMLSICFEDSHYTDEELAKIIKAIRKKTKFVRLNKDTIIEIDDETGEQLCNTIDEFGLDPNHLNETQQVPLYLALKLADKNIDVISYQTTDELKNLIKDISEFKKAPYEPPKSIIDKMRGYQIEAFKWMKTLIKYGFSGILADDMGLGKSLEMISIILDSEIKQPSLIVCPKSLCYNWKNEFFIWAPEIEVVNIIGQSNERKELIASINPNEKKVYITSYDSLRNDIKLYENKDFNFMILDEGQYIKNHETLKAQSVKVIKSNTRFVLTGTPIENSVLDLWSIFDFLMPNYLGNYHVFKSTYEREVIQSGESKIVRKLILKITPFILRRTKKEVIKDLPDKIETTLSATMDKDQRAVYEAELLRTKDILLNSDNKIQILACLTRLRQICVDPHLYINNYEGSSCKIDLLMEQLEEYINTGHRIVIFSQFTTIFDKLTEIFKQHKYRHFILTGSTPAKDRVIMATTFNENPDIKIFLVSLKAGGTGLNLIGADTVIHLDPWWNVAAQNQATDRTHRIGQKKNVQVIRLICENSIEQKVIELQNRKKEVVEKLVADDDNNITNLSNDDLNFILN